VPPPLRQQGVGDREGDELVQFGMKLAHREPWECISSPAACRPVSDAPPHAPGYRASSHQRVVLLSRRVHA
jgi:hypothetical protein